MRLSTKDAVQLGELERDAIQAARGERGRIDHKAAARTLADHLQRHESDGHAWAATVLDAATNTGLTHRIKAAAKRMRVPIRMNGTSIDMPAVYSRRQPDGGTQLEMWMWLDLSDLEALIGEMREQAGVLGTRVEVLRFARDLMVKHDASSAHDAFVAEGIDPVALSVTA